MFYKQSCEHKKFKHKKEIPKEYKTRWVASLEIQKL